MSTGEREAARERIRTLAVAELLRWDKPDTYGHARLFTREDIAAVRLLLDEPSTALAERAQIVAWLRKESAGLLATADVNHALRDVASRLSAGGRLLAGEADAVERGEHSATAVPDLLLPGLQAAREAVDEHSFAADGATPQSVREGYVAVIDRLISEHSG